MKLVNLKSSQTKIKREHILGFGESIYHDPGVRSVVIKVAFKDGSNVGFHKDEDDDDIESLFMGGDD